MLSLAFLLYYYSFSSLAELLLVVFLLGAMEVTAKTFLTQIMERMIGLPSTLWIGYPPAKNNTL